MRLPSSRRHGASARAAAVAVAVAALAGGLGASPAGALTAAGAPAATADPVVHAVAGNRTITVAWSAVRGATGYTVHWNGSTRATTATHLAIGGLRNGVTVKTTVTARGVTGSSSAVRATPVSGYPSAVTRVTAAPGTGDSIIVHAAGGGHATRIGVIAGADVTTGIDHFHTSWYPATQRTFRVTVPARLLARLGRASGNAVYVKVVQSNAPDRLAPMHLRSTAAEDYRVSSDVGTRAIAGAATPTPAALPRLTVAEMNIQSLAATSAFSTGNQWRARAPRAARTVLAAHPDLLLTAELGTTRIDPSCTSHPTLDVYCTTQRDDFAARLHAGGGYSDVFPDADRRVYDFGVAHPSLATQVTFGTQMFYDPRRLVLGSHGTVSPELTLRVSPWSSAYRDRWFSWAVFTMKASGRRFLAVAAHFPSGHDSTSVAARADEARKVVPYVDAKAAGLPIVLAGDFNADPVHDPNPDVRILVEHGYLDAAATTQRSGSHYATFAGRDGADGVDYGYPVTAYRYPATARRIDFILLKHSPYPVRYANVIHLAAGSSTRFDRAYQGSDHLMQLATVGIGPGVAP